MNSVLYQVQLSLILDRLIFIKESREWRGLLSVSSRAHFTSNHVTTGLRRSDVLASTSVSSVDYSRSPVLERSIR